MMEELLAKVKANLILTHDVDDALLQSYITAAVSYAESYQHIPQGTYADNVQAAKQVWDAVNTLLRIDREWKV